MSPSQNSDSVTFEQLAESANQFDLESLRQATANGPQGNNKMAIDPSVICKAYNIVKPVLVILSRIPIIPSKYRQALDVFINFMNGICG